VVGAPPVFEVNHVDERKLVMHRVPRLLAALLCVVAAGIVGCSAQSGNGDSVGEHRGEHEREGGERGGDGEESGVELARTETYDEVRNGVRLILAFDVATNSFEGRVVNTTERTLRRVRVEVHLSNGKELGPTTAGDLVLARRPLRART
jgi:hypothetical protein